MIVPIPYVHIGLGALIAIIAIPLVLRRVPMNRSYGIRIREAFVSEENWYAVNAYGGKLLLGFGVFLLVFGIAEPGFAPSPRSLLAPVFLGLPLLAIFPVLARIRSFARRLPGR